MTIRVNSEVGRLRRVLVHRPGLEIERMVPSRMGELLFDDILYGEQARQEHERFTAILAGAGVEVLDSERLLAEILEEDGPREALFADLGREYGVREGTLATLRDLGAEELAGALIGGVRSAGPTSPRPSELFDLAPLPNYFFQRDPQSVIGGRVVIASMATEAREREPLLARMVFQHHPALSGHKAMFEIDRPPSGAPEHDPRREYPTLEGGDVLVGSPDTLIVGISQRTNRRGVEVLAEYLRREPTPFRHLLLVELPVRRSYMHLDTVFTFIDKGLALAYAPILDPGSAEVARIYRVDLTAEELAFRISGSLQSALAAVGIELSVISCGGTSDPIDQEREQWTDGANAFAVAPGVVLLYRRNRRTIDSLAEHGFRVVSEDEVLEDGVPILGRGRTVVTIAGDELSRARGGPRCMTMPIERDSLDEIESGT